MAEGAWFWVDGVVVVWVSHDVVLSVSASDGVASKANAAIGEAFAVAQPVAVTAPAVVDGIPCPTSEETQVPSFRMIAYAPVKIHTSHVNMESGHSISYTANF